MSKRAETFEDTRDVIPSQHEFDTRVKLTIAVIAFAATLVGAIVGATASIYVGNLNADTQTRIARYDYTHTQKQTAYAAALNDASLLGRATADMKAKLGSSSSQQDLSTMFDTALKSEDQYGRDLRVLEIMAPMNVNNHANDLYDDFDGLITALSSGMNNQVALNVVLPNFESAEAKANNDSTKLLDDMQADLAAN